MAINQKAHSVLSPIRHVMRQLGAVSSPLGYKTGLELDADISSLVLQGYKVINTHYLGMQTDLSNGQPYYGILYILVLEQSEVERMRQERKTEE